MDVIIICKTCNKEFIFPKWQNRIYCSTKCYTISRLKPQTIFHCQYCGIGFVDEKRYKYRKFCSNQCKGKIHHKEWKPSYSSIRKRYEIRGLIKKCEKCGYNAHPEILGIHHIDENRRNNSKENLIVLCPNCHSLEHKKHISH